MKAILLTILIIICTCNNRLLAQQASIRQTEFSNARTKQKMNFFVISKRKKGRFDLATRYNIFRTKLKSLFHGKTFSPVVASSVADMQQKVEKKLNKRKAVIGTIWFDSHGKYKKGYALFFIGKDEVNHLSVMEGSIQNAFKNLSKYTTDSSRYVIGSCYGVATFRRLINNYTDSTMMKGDSLMIALGGNLQKGTVYGSESWVMSRPGLFLKRLSVYGSPGRKIFHDKVYKPAWEHVGQWNKYSVSNASFKKANAITLNSNGHLIEFEKPYHLKKKYRKNIRKIVRNLQPGLVNRKP